MKSSLGCLDTLFFALLFLIVSLLSCEITIWVILRLFDPLEKGFPRHSLGSKAGIFHTVHGCKPFDCFFMRVSTVPENHVICGEPCPSCPNSIKIIFDPGLAIGGLAE